jgi:hypothetical protein
MNVLLVNPPIYDFTAFDFWLRPYGLLRVGGRLRTCELTTFDYLVSRDRDAFGRGRFDQQLVVKPRPLADIPRHFYRFGRPRGDFLHLLSKQTFDVVLVQTVMTYWYPGVREVIEDIRQLQPQARIILGGVYATLCPSHARSLGADQVLEGLDLTPLGLARLGARHIAFYDDALLFKPERILLPFLEAVVREDLRVSFHTPNALNARFITPEVARLMVRAGFKTFFLGFESSAYEWQRKTGGKVYSEEFATATRTLREAGAASISAYVIIGHPDSHEQNLEGSIRFAAEQGARVMLSEFAPIPGTPDGDACGAYGALVEPLNHNKTAFTLRFLGSSRVDALKALCKEVNRLHRYLEVS